MEGLIQSSPEIRSITDLSTALVATIMDAKEQISQIEHLFCDQLYPSFQSKSKMFTIWKEKENDFLLQIERLSRENESQRVRINELEANLRLKDREIDEGLEMHSELLYIIESKSSELIEKERKLKEKTEEAETNLIRNEEEIRALVEKVVQLERTSCQLRLSNQEVRSNAAEMKKLYEDSEIEKKRLLVKVNELEEDLRGRTTEADMRKCINAYKRLKSQYNYLIKISGLNYENVISLPKLHDNKSDSSTKNQNQIFTSPGLEEIDIGICEKTRPDSSKISADHSPGDKRKLVSAVKIPTSGGKKRPTSSWRDTRTHQGKTGPDPHDEFLDTPLENIKRNVINKATMREEPKNDRVSMPNDANDSDDETQDLNAARKLQSDKGKSFKFVEPVWKKAEREKLKGVECKQCKKFYDAVLCDGEGYNDGNNNNNNLRCEHHEGVSRHRYRYIPPSTPEGFWNIGFESEM